MSGLSSHSVGSVENGHSAVPTPTATSDLTIGAPARASALGMETTKARLLDRAKRAVEHGDRSLRDAAEALGLAKDKHGATQREMAKAVGMSVGWVNRLLKWRQSGYKDSSPFGPTSRKGRVQRAEQRHRPHRTKSAVNPDHRTNATDCTVPQPTETTAPEIADSACRAAPERRNRSPSEVVREFRFAIDHWWPLLDDAGRAEIVSYFTKKTAPGGS